MEKMIAELKHPKLKSISTDGRSILDSLAKQEKPHPTPASSVEASNRSPVQVAPFKHGYSRDSGISVYTMTMSQWAAGGFEEFLNIMNFYVFLIVWDNRVNKL